MFRRLILAAVLATVCVGAIAAVTAAGDGSLRTGVREVARDPVAAARDVARKARSRGARSDETLRMARCPAQLAGCREVRGRIVYVEAVDPDGDGDLHVVVASGSITAPGLTSIDVRPDLRPSRVPRIGDLATAAGQVQPGHIGQQQIHAEEFRVRALTR